ncbi:Receptor-type tyrosine-protein phosphatase gamma [Hypsizygus marmoreus]|uniref:protein-tyrosine-phosphatase n=1 Tax=Hypsizygus marmoreus TaxID=39966 RepID=A0A369K9B2_HYPMA|nr:Receptor-type tyrosine-protein phosphatase gamma [Hypsizygus marmoreus]
MDFFSAVRDGEQRSAPTDADDVATFAEAIATRYGASSADILTARLITPVKEIPIANMTLTPSVSASTSQSTFTAIAPAALAAYLADPATLVLDIRPHAAYADARLPRALSLSVPSTLLKRPLFSLQRLAAMLPSPAARTRFSTYRDSARILVYDADASAIPDSSNIQGLLRKFKNDDFGGELAWLRGGFQAVWRECRDLVETTPEKQDDDDADEEHGGRSTAVLRARHLPMAAFSLSSTTRRPLNSQTMSIPLPTSQPMPRPAFNPFFDTIRQNVELSHGITERIALRLPRRVRRRIADLPFTWLQEIAKRADRTPKTLHTHARHAHRHVSSTASRAHPPPSSSSSSSSSSVSDSSDSDSAPSSALIEEGTEALAMQFYRIELAEQRRLMGVMEHHSKESGRLGAEGVTHASRVFPFSITAGVEKGAKNRYRHIWPFEHARVRLHCAGSAGEDVCRWGPGRCVDDYVNASYVQPLGTHRRYIATQGPLEATFNDFWRLCWEQNVHVIVMLTKEVEGSMVKCGAYWADVGVVGVEPVRVFGPLTLKLVSKVGLPGDVELMHGDPTMLRTLSLSMHDGVSVSGGFAFPTYPAPIQPLQQHEENSESKSKSKRHHRRVTTIKRTFELTNAAYPHLGPRKVVQLQYLEWPDMNVPDDPRGVLGLIKEADRAVEETGGTGEGDACVFDGEEQVFEVGGSGSGRKAMRMDPRTGIARHALGGKRKDGKMRGNRPVLLHCSAGVGRTGGFIAVDAVLDAIRREMGKRKEKEREGEVGVVGEERKAPDKGREKEDAMDVDDDGREPVMTVPIPVSGDVETGSVEGGGESDEKPVVHVPAVVVPTSSPPTSVEEGGTTPMQVDDAGLSGEKSTTDVDVDSEAERPTALTRKWAESVLDYNGSSATPLAPLPVPVSSLPAAASVTPPPSVPSSPPSMPPSSPPVSTATSTSASEQPLPLPRRFPPVQNYVASGLSSSDSSSTFPSTSDSEDPRGGKGQSSSLATSVSGASASVEGLAFGFGKDEEQKEMQQPSQRVRTFSAPQVPVPMPMKTPLALGSSPLAKSRSDEEAKVVAEPMRLSLSASVALPSPSLPRYSSRPHPHLAPHPHPHPHPLSKSSPPLHMHVHVPSEEAQQTTVVDYKEPRALHADVGTPGELSGYEEPIWEVVQDMREQRMSLCQSLRQYVFVHAAVIEGALGIVDEEREREVVEKEEREREVVIEAARDKREAGVEEESERVMKFGGKDEVNGYFSFSAVPPTVPVASIPPLSPSTPTHPTLTPVQIPFTTTPMGMRTPEKIYPPLPQTSSTKTSDGSSSSTGKRGASPTELLKEGKKGEVLLSKRPSIKRKVRTPQELRETSGLGTVPSSPLPLP